MRKRILAIDFGLQRVGVAVSDELHIAIKTLPTLLFRKPDFWPQLMHIITSYQIGTIVLGVPYEEDEEHSMRLPLESFQAQLHNTLEIEGLSVPIYHVDESYTSINAVKIMLEIGTRKKKRATKGTKDGIAAALILREYLSNATQ